jgi:hypothetical protein
VQQSITESPQENKTIQGTENKTIHIRNKQNKIFCYIITLLLEYLITDQPTLTQDVGCVRECCGTY